MPIYRTPSLFLDDTRVPDTTLAYYRLRLQQALHGFIVREFNRLADETQFTQKALAERIGRDPARMSHWLSKPSNLEFDTFSDLMVGMGIDPRTFVARMPYQPVGMPSTLTSIAPAEPAAHQGQSSGQPIDEQAFASSGVRLGGVATQGTQGNTLPSVFSGSDGRDMAAAA